MISSVAIVSHRTSSKCNRAPRSSNTSKGRSDLEVCGGLGRGQGREGVVSCDFPCAEQSLGSERAGNTLQTIPSIARSPIQMASHRVRLEAIETPASIASSRSTRPAPYAIQTSPGPDCLPTRHSSGLVLYGTCIPPLSPPSSAEPTHLEPFLGLRLEVVICRHPKA